MLTDLVALNGCCSALYHKNPSWLLVPSELHGHWTSFVCEWDSVAQGVEMQTRCTSWSVVRISCLWWTFELDRYGQCLHISVMSVFCKDDGIAFTTKCKSFQICLPCTSPEEREVLQSGGFFWVCLQLWCCEWSGSPSMNTVVRCLWQTCVLCSDPPGVDFQA